MKRMAYKKRQEVHTVEGDNVFVELRPYRQRLVGVRKNEKLAPKYSGPYTIERKIGSGAYKLILPPEATIHPVFHVSQLRAALGTHQATQTSPAKPTDQF